MKHDLKTKAQENLPQVLVADDDPQAAALIQLVTTNFGLETTLAFDGLDAVKKISAKSFDLVFLDICMPGLTGLDVLAKIGEARKKYLKYNKEWHVLPVIIYSSQDQEKIKIPVTEEFYIIGQWEKSISLPDLTSLLGAAIDRLGFHS